MNKVKIKPFVKNDTKKFNNEIINKAVRHELNWNKR